MSKARKSSSRRPISSCAASQRRPVRASSVVGRPARRLSVSERTPQTAAIGRFVPRALAVPIEPVLKVQGYVATSRSAPMVRAAAEAVTAIANRIFTPEVRYRRLPIANISGGVLVLENGARFHCPAFDRVLADCREIVVFVLTLGESFDHVSRRFSVAGQLLEAVLFETAGWIAIEQATKQFARHLGESEGLRLTRRMAPGYQFSGPNGRSEWPLAEQAGLFDLFGEIELPVRLLESCVMMPKMSRSGLYGASVSPLPAGQAPDETAFD